MDEVKRKGVKAPAGWQKNAHGKLPKTFQARAKAFQKLPLDSPKRRKGFAAYAPAALPPPKKGKKSRDFLPAWRTDKRVKEAIGKMSRGRCAYCQSSVTSNQAGHVEHFKPKKLFPLLAYLWGNYFLVCEKCNLAKGDQWPFKHQGKSYVRPDEPNPGRRFVFLPDGSVKGKDKEAQLTCDHFKLNRPALRKDRREFIKIALRPLREALALGAPISAAMLKKYGVPALSQFSQAVNQSAQVVWAQGRGRVKTRI